MPDNPTRKSLHIIGMVQGVGFRPFVYKLAHKYALNGFVQNGGDGVYIEVQGDDKNIEHFIHELQESPPPLARIDALRIQTIATKNTQEFIIDNSTTGTIDTLVLPDISMCEACREEMLSQSDRRHSYALINCTDCGPRYTIIKNLPYDRNNTSMKQFVMCRDCDKEYHNPKSRRYHAQPISCPACGPQLFLEYSDGTTTNESIFEKVCNLLEDGETIAIKGMGGFHLVCDATNEEAVMRLRVKKNRPSKPLAVMFGSLKDLKNNTQLTQEERLFLTSIQRPIVVVQKSKKSILAPSIAPNMQKIGVFLAYTPLHELLLHHFQKPIVATSANISGEPIITDEQTIFEKLSHVVACALTHDRAIVNGCDDSVMMSVEAQPLFLRVARGYAPLSFYTQKKAYKTILALGANQKSTITLGVGEHLILSAYIGDLDSLASLEYFDKTVETFLRLYDCVPQVLVYDKHPHYESTKWAKNYLEQHSEVDAISLQHHYAHALGVMAEYNITHDVVAFCFDGTGYGDDGSLWGGEVLDVGLHGYKRLCHLQQFSLLGGEKAIKEPKRVAMGLLFEMMTLQEIKALNHPLVDSFTQKELHTLSMMHTKKLNSPRTSSIGRLFDGVYALSGFDASLSYEGESGLMMESLAQECATTACYSYEIKGDEILFSTLIQEILKEDDPHQIATKFINTLSNIITDIAQHYAGRDVVLCGGVFQNKLLVEQTLQRFKEHNITYYISQKTTPNDGSISLGQAYYALHNQKG